MHFCVFLQVFTFDFSLDWNTLTGNCAKEKLFLALLTQCSTAVALPQARERAHTHTHTHALYRGEGGGRERAIVHIQLEVKGN